MFTEVKKAHLSGKAPEREFAVVQWLRGVRPRRGSKLPR